MEPIDLVHLQTPDKAYLHPIASMLSRTVDTHEHPVVDRDPLRIWLLAVQTKIIHVPFHFVVFLEIARLVL
jgi:hypothetical protein